jgi:hypothetical protein
MSATDEQRWVAEMVKRLERRHAGDEIDLEQRARTLARQLHLEQPASIRWVSNQEMRWGSCTPRDRTIRISTRLAREPGWVIDYVIVHELAHLSVAGHGPRFWDLVNRYRLAERARGFLMARGMGSDDEAEPDHDEPVGPPGHAPTGDGHGAGGEAVAAGFEPGHRPAGSYRRVRRGYS